MSSEELLAIIGGGYVGYLAITILLNEKDKNKINSSTEPKSAAEHETSKNFAPEVNDISSNWFQLLEVSELAAMIEITTQYKRKISQYHPDKVANLGAELKSLAEIKSKEINKAYEYAKSIR